MILFVVLLLFGSKQIPNLARGLGRGMREFKDAMNGIEREITNAANESAPVNNNNKTPDSITPTVPLDQQESQK
jgi:sec-independent protein translocase protein TatA